MFICKDCGLIFEHPKNICENLTPGYTPAEPTMNRYYTGCPRCEGVYESAIECAHCNKFYEKENLEFYKGEYWCHECVEEDIGNDTNEAMPKWKTIYSLC